MNLKKQDRKKGEISTNFLVSMILIIVGFIILIIFYLNLPDSRAADRQACESSVILRATAGALSPTAIEKSFKESFPLKCKTQKFCFGDSKSICRDFIGEKGITRIKVKNIRDIEKTISEEMLNCWQMMGEGKLDLFSGGAAEFGLSGVQSSCVICTRMAFNKTSLNNSKINLDLINVEEYMLFNKVPEENISYMEYISGNGGLYSVDETRGMPVLDSDGKVIGRPINSEDKVPYASLTKDPYKESAIIFMQVSAPDSLEVIKNTLNILGLGFGAGFFASPSKFGFLKATGTALKSLPTWIAMGFIFGFQMGTTSANRDLAAGLCGDVKSGSNARTGCSVVRLVDYNPEEIVKYCSNIESIP